jgi:hypothetical protein
MAVGNPTLSGCARATVNGERRSEPRPFLAGVSFQLPEELQLYPDQPQKGYPQ